MEKPNILFICSRNQWRSPTAENLYRKRGDIRVRSAGTSGAGRRRVTEGDIRWADLVVAMEDRHRSRLKDRFRGGRGLPPIVVLGVPDDYGYMDPELVDLLVPAIDELLAVHFGIRA